MLVNSTNVVNISTLGKGNRSINFTNLNSNEGYYYNVTIEDYANNKNSTETRKITLDSIYPTINFTSPTPANNTNQTSTTLIINIIHNETNPHTIILYWNGTQNETKAYSGNYTNFTLTNLNDGLYTYYIWLNDSARNYNSTENRTIRIDTTPPIIYLKSPNNDTWRNNNTNNRRIGSRHLPNFASCPDGQLAKLDRSFEKSCI